MLLYTFVDVVLATIDNGEFSERNSGLDYFLASSRRVLCVN